MTCTHGPDCQRCDLLTWAETATAQEVADRVDELETNSEWLRARLNDARAAVAALVPPPADTSSTYFAGVHDGYATAIQHAVKAIEEGTG